MSPPGPLRNDGFVSQDDRPFKTIFRNVATRYLSVAAEMAIGLITLPFNLHHLGTEAYGLWMLTAGVTIHFSILDLGYGGAMVLRGGESFMTQNLGITIWRHFW